MKRRVIDKRKISELLGVDGRSYVEASRLHFWTKFYGYDIEIEEPIEENDGTAAPVSEEIDNG